MPSEPKNTAKKSKRKLTGSLDKESLPPVAKRRKVFGDLKGENVAPPTNQSEVGVNQKASSIKKVVPPKRKLKRGSRIYIRTRYPQLHRHYRYNPVTLEWQHVGNWVRTIFVIMDAHQVALMLLLKILEPLRKYKEMVTVCFEHCAYAITGSESQYSRLHSLIVENLRSFIGTERTSSVELYHPR